jgi:hypothetical protein
VIAVALRCRRLTEVPVRAIDRAVLDVLLLATMLLVCGGIGLPIAELLPSRFAGRVLVAPVLGLAVLSVAAPVTYRWGVPVLVLFVAIVIVAVASLAWWGPRIAARGLAAEERRLAITITACWLGVTLVMLLPRWVGGEQFSVFQGNVWDAFGYLESAVVYARKPYSIVSAANDAELMRNPLYVIAQNQLNERPSVHLLYATFSRIAPAEAYRLCYPFLVGCLSQFLLVAVFVLRAVLPKARPAVWLAAAAVFPLGFWGQYVFDINAWSQIASAPILFLMFGLVLHVTIAPAERGDGVRLAGVLAIVVAGGVFLYPEGFLIYTAALGPFAVVVPAVRMIRARGFALRPLVPLAGIAGIAAVVLYSPLVQFLIRQATWSSTTKVWWWKYFQAFFYGRDGAPGDAADFVGGLFGLYFATPGAGTAAGIAVVLRVAIVATVVALVLALALVRERELAWDSRAMLIGWFAIAVLLLLPAAVFVYRENYWPAGKVVSYAAPVFMTLLATPIAFRFAHRALRPLRWFAIAFVAFQLALGLVRIAAAGSADGIHYAAPYPSISVPQFKQQAGWDVTGLDAQLTRKQRVLIEPMEQFPESYLMMYLYTHRIPFAKSTPVHIYFNEGREIGPMPPMWSPDVSISIERTAFVLRFRDRRPDVRVSSRPD